MLTREQHYAAAIMKQVKGIKKDHPDLVESYGAMAHKLPILIRTAGLAQALAFLVARKKDAYNLLLDDLAAIVLTDEQAKTRAVLVERSQGMGPPAAAGQAPTLLSLNDYMRLSQQVLAALLWYKRFAQSVLDVDPTADLDSGATPAPSTLAPAVPTAGGDTP